MTGLRAACIAGTLCTIALLSSTPIPSRACVFVQKFEQSSKAGRHVSVWERVVYSLIQAQAPTE
jgi:hypothetical protein